MSTTQYVLMPPRRTVADRTAVAASTRSFLRSLIPAAPSVMVTPDLDLQVVDSIAEEGMKLVEMSEATANALRALQPELVVAPVVYYRVARAARPRPRVTASVLRARRAVRPAPIRVRVTDRVTGDPMPGVRVDAFTDFENLFGATGDTDAQGEVQLDLGATSVQLERLVAYPAQAGHWGFFVADVTLNDNHAIALEPIDLTVPDSVRALHGSGAATDGDGVRVAVLDTGVGPHPDLVLDGIEEDGGDVDNGDGHGTHVAGIIASRGTLPDGLAGVAPGVTLNSYRVFGQPQGLAANFDIAAAIDQAVADGCDLINMSLAIDHESNPQGTFFDDTVARAIDDAWVAGCLPIAAAGNDDRSPVDFPAKDTRCLAVSALGVIGTFPPDSTAAADIAEPFAQDPNQFIAGFSNVGPEIDLTGPGVGIVSTVPGGYGVDSGTSMACPAVTGMVARLLSQRQDILDMPRDANRAAEMAKLALQSASPLGFPTDLEGQGLLT